MKKLSCILFLLIFCLAVGAQTKKISVDDYQNQAQLMERLIHECFTKNKIQEAEKYIHEAIFLFSQLPTEDMKKKKFIQANNYYNLTCAYSRQNKKDSALVAFEKCINDWEYSNYSHARIDTDLDNIRSEPRFVELMSILGQKCDYLSMLKKSGSYLVKDTFGLPEFGYEISSNDRLRNVKNYFKLDSIAGQGNEISKIINIMSWVHNNIRHDGNNFPLCEFDAIDFYNYYKATGKGINCRALAITLNECYLSMGIKSRFITCMPKNENDNDCHVINCVYSNDLKKWIWIDPTFNAYIKDENGNFLSIEEVRERLINGKQLVLNKDANWNNQNPQTKEMYLESYMAKNLYWIQCPLNSYFNIESRYRYSNEKYVSLMPLDYERSNSRANEFITNDPAYFWQTPK